MRSLVCVSLLLVVLAAGQNRHTLKNLSEKDDQSNQDSKHNPPVQAQVAKPNPSPEANEHQNEKNDHKTVSFLTHGEWVMAILTFVYVGLTAFYARTSHKTLKRIEEQVEIADRSAKAALLNAQAVINSQRPWIVVRIENKAKPFAFEAICVSGIPAKITQSYADWQAVDSGESLQPVYKTKMLQYPFILAPSDGGRHIWDFSVDSLQANTPLWKQIQGLGKTLYFLGKIEYIDAVSFDNDGKAVVHETRWCYEYIGGQITRSGPNTEFNNYT